MRVLVTGSAGFIGFHLCRLLLDEGATVHGVDGFTPYYDVQLKRDRAAILSAHPRFSQTEALLEQGDAFDRAADAFAPDVIVHLAAQAGVRHSIEAPRAYVDANITGTLVVMEAARRLAVRHLLMASSSSVYGANATQPFRETDKADLQLSFYGATKKANESMAHAWAHVHGVPITMFRFFTVYGTWGRPDLAYFRFADAILRDRPIDVYNNGRMWRDFTAVEDIVRAIRLLVDVVPGAPETAVEGDSLSPVAPFRVVNIGNSDKVALGDFIAAIEDAVGRKARRNLMPMQPGDVVATWADATLLRRLTGYRPGTDLREGMARFVAWYRERTGL